jgi:hypothetical protein
MKRIVLAAALLVGGGAVSAYADTDVWAASHPRSDLWSANQSCNAQFGAPQNGVPTSAAYKRCMAGQGWRFSGTQHDDSWVNHRGMTCHPILNGFGSECSSF